MLEKTINFINKIRENRIASKLQPTEMKHNDIYLVEYPKSGITYLCHLLAHIEHFKKNNLEINFFNIHSFIPDIHQSKNISDIKGQYIRARMIKSHASYTSSYRYVIHLVRDPLDVMISYKNYLNDHWGLNISFSKLIRSWRGIPRWIRHTDSWINSDINQKYIPVHFKLLLSHPDKVLKYIYKSYGIYLPDDTIKSAIEASSLENMLAAERLWNYGYREKFANARFVGKKNFILEDVSNNDKEYILKNTNTLNVELLSMCETYLK